MSGNGYFSLLQAGRGLAAFGVVWFHVMIIAAERLDYQFAVAFFRSFEIGVDFFFVLSGFIIYHTCHKHIGHPEQAVGFLFRRFMRIYPLVLVFSGAKLSYLLISGSGIPDYKKDPIFILCSLLLIPQTEQPFIAVLWSLSFEVFFYLIFLQVILYGPKGIFLMGLHTAACLGMSFLSTESLPFPMSFLFSPHCIEFYLGCLAAWILLRKPNISQRAAMMLIVASAILIIVAAFHFSTLLVRFSFRLTYLWGIAFFALIIGLATWEHRKGAKVPVWLLHLGNASFSIYLVHTSALEFAVLLIGRKLDLLAPSLPILLTAAGFVSVGCGMLVHHFVERPILKMGKAGFACSMQDSNCIYKPKLKLSTPLNECAVAVLREILHRNSLNQEKCGPNIKKAIVTVRKPLTINGDNSLDCSI